MNWTSSSHHSARRFFANYFPTYHTFVLSIPKWLFSLTPKSLFWVYTCKSELLHEAFCAFHVNLVKYGRWPRKDGTCSMQQACLFLLVLVSQEGIYNTLIANFTGWAEAVNAVLKVTISLPRVVCRSYDLSFPRRYRLARALPVKNAIIERSVFFIDLAFRLNFAISDVFFLSRSVWKLSWDRRRLPGRKGSVYNDHCTSVQTFCKSGFNLRFFSFSPHSFAYLAFWYIEFNVYGVINFKNSLLILCWRFWYFPSAFFSIGIISRFIVLFIPAEQNVSTRVRELSCIL